MSTTLPRAVAVADEMFRLRRHAWQKQSVLSLRRNDPKLTPAEREVVNAIGDRLYGATTEQQEG